ncbi:alpha/beta hydrolase [Streptomyces sp. NPDC001980]|uniref:alpha/beta hydrolase n=1 Tax=Streptomyces sp. NPDC001980 TaxID=3157126 RepID=UPI003329F11B
MPEAYGQIPQLRAALEARGAGYAMAVACSTWVWINHYEQGKHRNPSPEAKQQLQERFTDDERALMRGAEPERQFLISNDPDVPSAYKDPAMAEYENQWTLWENARYDRKVTLRSTLKAQMYDPGVWIERIAPTPLLMIVGTQDTVTPTDMALAAYERAGEPKKLSTYDGGHFDAYVKHFNETAVGAGEWFVQHLKPTSTN